jgi:hypothetical protein
MQVLDKHLFGKTAYVRIFTYFGATTQPCKYSRHMTKEQIKSYRITSFGEFISSYRLFDQFTLGKVINDTVACAVLRTRLPVG